jgi:hypothetical protein
MAKKLTFDKLPAAVERILEILNSDTSEHTALPEIVRRLERLEKKIDHLEKSMYPDRFTMEMHEVCRVLKLRPKAVNELAMSGVLHSFEQGKKRVFYEDDVVIFYMNQPAWRAAKEGAFASSEVAEEVAAEAAGSGEMVAGSGSDKPVGSVRPGAVEVGTKPVGAKPVNVRPKPVDAGRVGAKSEKSASESTGDRGRRRLDIHAAGVILKRSAPAIYQLIATTDIPRHKSGRALYFWEDELREWGRIHPPKPRKNK